MNRLYELPEDIQNKIFEKVHKDKYKECLKDMMITIRDDKKCKKRFETKYKKFFETFLKETTYHNTDFNILISLISFRDALDYKLERYRDYIEENPLYTKLEKDIYLSIYYERLKSFLFYFTNCFTNAKKINHFINLNYPVYIDIIDNYESKYNVSYYEHKDKTFKELYEHYEKLINDSDDEAEDTIYLLAT